MSSLGSILKTKKKNTPYWKGGSYKRGENIHQGSYSFERLFVTFYMTLVLASSGLENEILKFHDFPAFR